MLTKELAKERARQIMWRFDSATTVELRRRFVALDPTTVERFRSYLLDRWSQAANEKGERHAQANHAYWESEIGRCDLYGHTVGRLIHDRHEYVPWLNALCRLDGARVLEIGFGSGSSIMALAEQGSELTGIDVVPEAIDMTRARFRFFGLGEPSLHVMNATEIGTRFDRGSFDLVIFFASLEHMTHNERLPSLQAAWRLVADRGILCIAEAPNRLWLFDDHTSGLPFFYWLPDEIALEYWKQSSRFDHAPVFDTASGEAMLEFSRRGRGVSFHEIELALGPIQNLDFEVDRQSFQMGQNMLRWLHYRQSNKRRYANMLRRQRRDLPFGFFMPYLHIAIRKQASQCQ